MSTLANHCRHCQTPLHIVFADLGAMPIANDYILPERLNAAEPYYPLRAFVCEQCKLVQLQDFVQAQDVFREDYAYFSSTSSSWLAHARNYADATTEQLNLNADSFVVELASNDGYLLQYFKTKSIPVLGIEPCESVAHAAIRDKNIPTEILFFGQDTARDILNRYRVADLIVANNVLAHVPDINDFVAGVTVLLAPEGVATFEFPHLLSMIEHKQYDTIYHEHFSYISLFAAQSIMEKAGLRIFHVEQLPTHGGSLRLHVCHKAATRPLNMSVARIVQLEQDAGLHDRAAYTYFAEQVRESKRALLTLLIQLKREGKAIVGYGAPAKGNTLLNYCGIGADMLEFTVDRAVSKQGMYLPGSRLPILAPEAIRNFKPNYVFILPWNLKAEIMAEMAYIREWGGQFIVSGEIL